MRQGGRALVVAGGASVATLFAKVAAENLSAGHERTVDEPIKHAYGVEDPAFERTTGALFGPGLVAGNRITPLVNGREIFPAMLEAIRGARRSITFETYIYWSGEIGRAVAEALADRARAGVAVHVVIDGFGGNRLDDELLNMMVSAGALVERFHPLRPWGLGKLNHRTHRKLLVIDGRVGFTGGVGIADTWMGDAEDADHWRDTHFRVEGPVVAQMQGVFMDHWLRTRGELLHGDDYFPALEPVGETKAHMMRSSSKEGSESMRLLYLLAIASAKRKIRLASAYFVPDELAMETLLQARRRGVDLQVLVPSDKIDIPITHRASRASWGKLLRAGIELYEFAPTMFHVKTLVVDDLWVTVGSTNFDNRSFRLNDEANLSLFDRGIAAQLCQLFEADKARAQRITMEMWRARPVREKIVDSAAFLLRTQL